MPFFRCTDCGHRTESPVVIGAGDCPHCGGDVIFDLRGGRPAQKGQPGFESLRRRLLKVLRR